MIPEPKEKNKSSDIRRLPEWFKVKAPGSENYLSIKKLNDANKQFELYNYLLLHPNYDL